MSDRPAGRPASRASARKRAYTAHGTNDGTSTQRHVSPADGPPRPSRPRSAPRTGTLGGSNRFPYSYAAALHSAYSASRTETPRSSASGMKCEYVL
jgi:hypothetical protein